MRSTTRKGIERALQWRPGSIASILDGGEPIEQELEPAAEPESEISDAERVEQILEQIEQLTQDALKLRSGNSRRGSRRAG